MLIGIVLATCVIVVVSAGVFVVAGLIRDGVAGDCRQGVIRHYAALRDSIATEIRASYTSDF